MSRTRDSQTQNGTADPYKLVRGTSESSRLESQHTLWMRAVGWAIHPRIQENLGSTCRIADVGTGTGAWMSEVALLLGQGATVHGFDVSDAQFPPAESLPPNAKTHVWDMMQPAPAEHVGRFDMVHVRLVFLAMGSDDFERAARNVAMLLKPGGYIQWGELNPHCFKVAYRSHDDSTTDGMVRLGMLAHIAAFDRVTGGWSSLQDVLPRAGFGPVAIDRVSSDRDVQDRAAWSDNFVRAGLSVVDSARGVTGLSQADFEAVKADAERDLKSGAYYHIDLYTFVAQIV